MNALLNRAQFWFRELEIATEERTDFPEPGRTCLAVSRAGVDNLLGCLSGPIVVYDAIVDELRDAMGTNKFSLVTIDDLWIYIDTF
jgi:hypothetical protein